MSYRTLNGLFAIVLGVTLGLVWVATSHACIAEPGQCCQDIACDAGPVVCYETKAATGGFSLAVTDQFGLHSVAGSELKRLCAPLAPADIHGTHSVMYAAKDLTNPPRPSLTVQTTMGTFTRVPGQMRFLQTDAEKAIPPGAPAPLVANGLRTCYGFDKSHTNTDVTFDDQFGHHAGTVQEVAFLCLPASGGGLSSPDARLCFTMNITGPNATVNLNAPFGPPSAKIDHTDNWCIPATVL